MASEQKTSTRLFAFRHWLADIRFWIVVALLIRLFGIDNPTLETSHHWRQATVLMVARNYSETGVDLFHPRMDTAGDLTGVTGMEFPLLNAVAAWGTMLFGHEFWPGRLIVLLVGSLGVLMFHRLVTRRVSARAGLFAALLLLVSLWFMYSRKVMPDVFALSLVLIGLERLDASVPLPRAGVAMIFGVLCVCAGLLSKITAGCLLAAWPVLIWQHRRKPRAWLASLLLVFAVLPAVWWYFVWVPHLVEAYGYSHFFMGKPMSAGLGELVRNWPRTLDNFYFDALRFSGFAVVLVGLALALKDGQRGLLFAFLALAVAFAVVMLRSGDTFWIHAYYVLPFIPAMALLGGYGLARLPGDRWATTLLVLVAVEGLAAQANDFRSSPPLVPLLQLERDLGTGQGLIAMNTGDVPTAMYFAHRRGWTLTNAELQDPAVLEDLRARGCTSIVIFRRTFEGDVLIPWPVMIETPAYRIHHAPIGEMPPR